MKNIKSDYWLSSGEYLPEMLKDFHDAKDFFKTMIKEIQWDKTRPELQHISWVDAHIFSIDIFLWFMAIHGYKLQKSRKKLNFRNIAETIERYKKSLGKPILLDEKGLYIEREE
jgi:hypothetical protein